MLEPWIIGAFAAILSSIPTHLRTRLQPKEGGLQPRQTQVLPVVVGEQQYVLVCYYEVSGPVYGKAPTIYPPFVSVQVAYPSNEVRWQEVKPEKIGLTHLLLTPQKIPYLGTLEGRAISMSDWKSAKIDYYTLVSKVLERRWLLTRHPITAEEHATAKELQQYVRVLYDKPLLPYYQHEGRQFLAWLERAAK